MKKTLFAFLALATAFGATSCQSDEELTQPTGKPMVINAVAEGIGTGTRATMAYKYDILWSEGDQIIVKGDSESATFTLQSGKGTTEGTFACTDSPFGSGDEVEAYYPASLVDDGSLVWPAEQNANTIVPMYSKNKIGGTGTENFSFASLGAMLQIVFTTPQANVTLKSITLKDENATLSGAFSVDGNGKAAITATDKAGITLDLGDGVAVSNKIQYFHIAVPAGTYSDLTITFTATDESTCTLKGSATLTHNTVGRLVLTGTKFIPAGPLPGKFTVNTEGKQVRFSKGNLWADSDNALHFEANQYSYSSASTKDASHVSHFTWSSTVDAAVGNSFSGDYLFCDENHKVSVDGSDAIYYVLSKDEWEYLFNNHPYKWVTVNNVNGYVIAPDGFTGTLADSYADDAALATDNLVFLPAAGDCDGGGVDGQGSFGFYWSSTPDGSDCACRLLFDSGRQLVCGSPRAYGHSVRAVQNETPAAPATTGEAEVKADAGITGNKVKWVQLWENGPKFAEFNVGATSATDYGGHYTWGGNYANGTGITWNGDCNNGADVLSGDNDTATKLWGSNWRMPTEEEFDALLNNENCTCTWTDSPAGLLCKGKEGTAYAGNSVFLPAAGRCGTGNVNSQGALGYYWSSTPYGSDFAYYLNFSSGDPYVGYGHNRDCGFSVRAVLNE